MFKIKEDIVFTTHKDGTMIIMSLLDSENCYHKVTGISKDVFTALNSGKDLSVVKDEILSKYDVEDPTVEKDIDTFITYLKANNILEEV
jgi:hypothetical protein